MSSSMSKPVYPLYGEAIQSGTITANEVQLNRTLREVVGNIEKLAELINDEAIKIETEVIDAPLRMNDAPKQEYSSSLLSRAKEIEETLNNARQTLLHISKNIGEAKDPA